MTCRDFEHFLIPYVNGADIPEEARSHFAACERCRDLAAALRASGSTAAPSARQLAEIKSAILTDLKAVKPLVSAGVLIPALLSVVIMVVTAGVLDLGTAGWRAMNLDQTIAVFTSLAAFSGLLTVLLSRQIVPGSRVLISARITVLLLLGMMGGIFATLFHPHPESTFVATGLVCLRIGLEGAIAAGAFCWLILRRGAILDQVATGALTGALAGLGGLAILEIFCPNPNVYHILVWHLGSTAASVIAGTLVGVVSGYLSGRLSRFRQPFSKT